MSGQQMKKKNPDGFGERKSFLLFIQPLLIKGKDTEIRVLEGIWISVWLYMIQEERAAHIHMVTKGGVFCDQIEDRPASAIEIYRWKAFLL